METILVVDDEVAICTLLQELFTASGYSVLTANRGEEALATIEAENPQVVLLDLCLPGMSGLQVLRRTRAMGEDIGIIVISAVRDAEMARKALQMGADDYVIKPFDLRYLEKTVLNKLAGLAPRLAQRGHISG